MRSSTRAITLFFLLASGLFARELTLTVYNQNFALIRETRRLELDTGIQTVAFTDVAARIDPTSVHFESMTAPDRLTILEQNFEYDLVDAQKLLNKYVDQEIRLVSTKGEAFQGHLMNASKTDVVIRDRDGRIRVLRAESIQHFDFPELPDGLITRPTLVWLIENRGPMNQDAELSYLTDGITWHAEYVAVVDAEDRNLDLGAWVSLENRSGTTFEDARLKLVAGDVHRIQKGRRQPYAARRDVALAMEQPESQFEEKSFFEYHLYTLQRTATLKNNQTKQISLFPPARTSAKKVYVYDGAWAGKDVRVYVEFVNSRKANLGIPLPEGKIRVYKKDADDALEFVGEDQIDHTPENEKLRVFLGNAFDIVGERVQKESKAVGERSREDSIEIRLRNRKEERVEIVAVEHLYGDWIISKNTHPYVKKNAGTAEFAVTVPAKGEAVLTYTVLYRW